MASYSQGLLFAILACACVLSTLAARDLADDRSIVARHEQWMAKYGRVFKANVVFIESVNAGTDKFWLEANQFADITDDEFRATHTGYKASVGGNKGRKTGFRYANVRLDALPTFMDWRTKGAVTPIKDQGQCGCCWAFSTVASMEGIVKLSTGKLISLSEQELVDCDFIDNGGLTTEGNYPYTGTDGSCNSNKESNAAASIKGYEDVPANDEASLQKAVAAQPVSVAVDGGDNLFRFYKGGVLSGDCGTELDHGIAVVGYGVAGDGTKYWVMKNSWGTSWGENGFIRMERDVPDEQGLCGLAMQPSYPTA
ncbi:hypothetical protein VPH35_104123 [Triticum aestivum]